MCARQLERYTRLVVIEGGAHPRCCVVTGIAGGREELGKGSVRRIVGALVISLVTTVTSCRQGGVVAVDMT